MGLGGADTFGMAIKCINSRIMHEYFEGSSRDGFPSALALSGPLCSAARIAKISLSALMTWVSVMFEKLLGASLTRPDISLSGHF